MIWTFGLFGFFFWFKLGSLFTPRACVENMPACEEEDDEEGDDEEDEEDEGDDEDEDDGSEVDAKEKASSSKCAPSNVVGKFAARRLAEDVVRLGTPARPFKAVWAVIRRCILLDNAGNDIKITHSFSDILAGI